jgi:hypothetical protein
VGNNLPVRNYDAASETLTCDRGASLESKIIVLAGVERGRRRGLLHCPQEHTAAMKDGPLLALAMPYIAASVLGYGDILFDYLRRTIIVSDNALQHSSSREP